MLKAVCLIKRRAELTMEQFIDRYENGHAVLCRDMIPHMQRYVRRYVNPADVVLYPGAPPIDFDVITELWFENRQKYDSAMKSLEDPEKSRILAEDEKALFDAASIRRFVVDERDSALSA